MIGKLEVNKSKEKMKILTPKTNFDFSITKSNDNSMSHVQPSRNDTLINESKSINSNSVSIYLNRRHRQSQEKLKRMKEQIEQKEKANLKFKPTISKNSRKIVEKLILSEKNYNFDEIISDSYKKQNKKSASQSRRASSHAKEETLQDMANKSNVNLENSNIAKENNSLNANSDINKYEEYSRISAQHKDLDVQASGIKDEHILNSKKKEDIINVFKKPPKHTSNYRSTFLRGVHNSKISIPIDKEKPCSNDFNNKANLAFTACNLNLGSKDEAQIYMANKDIRNDLQIADVRSQLKDFYKSKQSINSSKTNTVTINSSMNYTQKDKDVLKSGNVMKDKTKKETIQSDSFIVDPIENPIRREEFIKDLNFNYSNLNNNKMITPMPIYQDVSELISCNTKTTFNSNNQYKKPSNDMIYYNKSSVNEKRRKELSAIKEFAKDVSFSRDNSIDQYNLPRTLDKEVHDQRNRGNSNLINRPNNSGNMYYSKSDLSSQSLNKEALDNHQWESFKPGELEDNQKFKLNNKSREFVMNKLNSLLGHK